MRTILLSIIASFAIVFSAKAQSYVQWKKETDKKYQAWRKQQNWDKKYFIWQQKADKDFERWKKENNMDEGDFDIDTSVDIDDDTASILAPYEADKPTPSHTVAPVKKAQNNGKQQKDALTTVTSEVAQEDDTSNLSSPQPAKKREDTAIFKPTILSQIKIWVIIVGVADYLKNEAKLKYADDDAYKVYGFFKSPEGGAVPEERIALLIDENANGKKIRQKIKSFSEQAGEDDVLLFYFSGHGVPNNILAVDFDQNDSGIIPHSFIKNNLEKSKAKHRYCILDACHSGSLSKLAESQPFYNDLKDYENGLVAILSSKGEETSLEASGKRQGVFSYFLIKGLHGNADYNKDKIISITELFDFTQQEVRNYTQNKQTPIITGDYGHTMPIALIR